MKVLALVHGYPPAVGGVEFAMRDICERLVAEHGFEVTVLTTNAYTNANFRDDSLPTVAIDPDELANGVRIRRFSVSTRWSPLLRVAQGVAWRLRAPGNGRLRTWYQGPISAGLRHAVRDQAADVVLAASFPLNHLHYAFRRPDGAPVVLLGAVHPWDRWGYERPNLVRLARGAAATVAFTASERDWFLRRGVPGDRLHVIPLGVEPESPSPSQSGAFRLQEGIPADAFLVAYFGQQGSHKGIDTLLRMLPRLLDRVPRAWLAVAGAPTPYSAELRRQAGQLAPEARRRVVFRDGLDAEAKAALFEDCDVFASPSRHESFGLTVLEAWAHGRPVVVGEGPAQRELLEGGALGRLVAYGDTDQLASTLAELAEAPEEARRLGEAGRARLGERYTLGRMAGAYRELLEQVVAERGAR